MADDQQKTEADLAHSREIDAGKVHASQIQTFSSDAMKAPALVAAAGIAAALGFFSANYQRLVAQPGMLDTFNDILMWLFISLLLTVTAPALAYFSQMAYAASIWETEWHMERPFIRKTRKSDGYKKAGDVCRWIAVSLVAGSIVALGWSGYLFLQIVR